MWSTLSCRQATANMNFLLHVSIIRQLVEAEPILQINQKLFKLSFTLIFFKFNLSSLQFNTGNENCTFEKVPIALGLRLRNIRGIMDLDEVNHSLEIYFLTKGEVIDFNYLIIDLRIHNCFLVHSDRVHHNFITII